MFANLDDPFPYTFFTQGQLTQLAAIYEDARRAVVAQITARLRGLVAHAGLSPDSAGIRSKTARTLGGDVLSLLADFWPFTAASMGGVGELFLGDLAHPQGGYPAPYHYPNSHHTPASWAYRLWAALFFRGAYSPEGDTFLGDNAPREMGVLGLCAISLAQREAGKGGVVFAYPRAGRFASVTESAQRNTYRRYFPYPLFCCTAAHWPWEAWDSQSTTEGARDAMTSYSAAVLSGAVEI